MGIYFVVIVILAVMSTVKNKQSLYSCCLGWEMDSLSNRQLKHRKVCSYVAMFLIFILIGFRNYTVGTDTASYMREYEGIVLSLPTNLTDLIRGEYGYKLLIALCKNIGLGWLGFQLIYAAFVSITCGIFIQRHSKDVVMAWILLISIGILPMMLTGIRQTLASMILLWAYIAIEKKRIVPFLLLYFVATSIHYTALVMIVLPFLFAVINEDKHKKVWLIVGILIPIACALFAGDLLRVFGGLLLEKYTYSGYFGAQNYSLNPIVLAMYWVMFLFSLIGLYLRKSQITKKELVFYILASVYIGALEASKTVYMLARLSNYFSLFLIVLLVNSIDSYMFDAKSKHLVALIISLLCIIAFAISTPGGSYGIDQYVFWRGIQ